MVQKCHKNISMRTEAFNAALLFSLDIRAPQLLMPRLFAAWPLVICIL
jgi:hypothetical protein